MKNYRCIMSGGAKVECREGSAGTAIMSALRKHPGQTVERCYAGFTAEDARLAKLRGATGVLEGIEDFEIPPHEPMTAEDAAKPRFVKRQNNTPAMFSENEMKGIKP